ncbi:MAG TPA: hypothetical protein VFC34_07760 [Puia sp.]|nr:hypothetical protein [Puia sp.]
MLLKKYGLPIALSVLVAGILWGCKKNSQASRITPPLITNDSIQVDQSLYNVSGSGGLDTGEILLALNAKNNAVLAILDQKGNLIKEKVSGLKTDNFQKWIIDGQTRYTYFQTEENEWELFHRRGFGELCIAGELYQQRSIAAVESAICQLSRP